MGCLPLAVTTHFCLTKQRGTTAHLLERHLTVFCIDEILPGYVVYLVNW